MMEIACDFAIYEPSFTAISDNLFLFHVQLLWDFVLFSSRTILYKTVRELYHWNDDFHLTYSRHLMNWQ